MNLHLIVIFSFFFHLFTEYRRLLLNSEIDLQAYFHQIGYKNYVNKETENVTLFYKEQETELLEACNALIEFIKYIKMDKDNAPKMSEIATCILQLKNSV